MHAFLIEPHQLTDYNLQTATSPDILHIYPEKSIGIDEVRKIQNFLSKKPIQEKLNTVVVHDADLLTLPAQNAFLKTLEEPPSNGLIYLVSSNSDNLLPTILSRVQKNQHDPQVGESRDFSASLQLIKQITSLPLSDRINVLETKNFTKTSAVSFLEDLEFATKSHQELISLMPKIWSTKKLLNANVNVRLCLGDFFFSIPYPE